MAGYSNQDNPWNDPNLAESFVCGKKVEKDRARDTDVQRMLSMVASLQAEMDSLKKGQEPAAAPEAKEPPPGDEPRSPAKGLGGWFGRGGA